MQTLLYSSRRLGKADGFSPVWYRPWKLGVKAERLVRKVWSILAAVQELNSSSQTCLLQVRLRISLKHFQSSPRLQRGKQTENQCDGMVWQGALPFLSEREHCTVLLKHSAARNFAGNSTTSQRHDQTKAETARLPVLLPVKALPFLKTHSIYLTNLSCSWLLIPERTWEGSELHFANHVCIPVLPANHTTPEWKPSATEWLALGSSACYLTAVYHIH